MELFDLPADPNENLLPYNGIVNYYGKVLSFEEANAYFKSLYHGVAWKNDESVRHGKFVVAKRKVSWFDRKSIEIDDALPENVKELKQLIERVTAVKYTSVLCNLYESGEVGISWHSDKDAYYNKEIIIASLTLGAERKFGFKHRQTGETVWKVLEHGSLLVMKGTTQNYWLHHLPPSKKIKAPRINLTFRKIVE